MWVDARLEPLRDWHGYMSSHTDLFPWWWTRGLSNGIKWHICCWFHERIQSHKRDSLETVGLTTDRLPSQKASCIAS
jgi:hypothetical protein